MDIKQINIDKVAAAIEADAGVALPGLRESLAEAKAGIYGFMRVLSIEGRKYGIRVMGLAPGAFTRMTSDLPGRRDQEPDPLSLPENVAPGVLYMASDLAADHTGKVLAVSFRGVREIKMMQTDGFAPGRPYTAQDVAAAADKVFFPAAPERTAKDG